MQSKHIYTAICATLALCGLVRVADAQVPYTFSAGSPARAAEVNENFTDLDARVSGLTASTAGVNENLSDLDARISALSASTAGVNENLSDLDARISALSASTSDVSEEIAIDCNSDAAALGAATLKPHTTYTITGACDGPITINKDGVQLLGADDTAAIVLPSGIVDPGQNILVQGAAGVRIENLHIDNTAYTDPAYAANFTRGILAPHAYLYVDDTRITGGTTGITSYDNATVRLSGTIEIRDFLIEGLSALNNANIRTSGTPTITVATTRTEGEYIEAINVYRSGVIDISGDFTVSIPTDNFDGRFSRALVSVYNSNIRIRNEGTISITGHTAILAYVSSTVRIQTGTIFGGVGSELKSFVDLSNITQSDGALFAGTSSNIRIGHSNVVGGGSGDNNVYIDSLSSLEASFTTFGNASGTGSIQLSNISLLILHNGELSGRPIDCSSGNNVANVSTHVTGVGGGSCGIGDGNSNGDTENLRVPNRAASHERLVRH